MKTIYLSANVTGHKNRHQDTHGKTELHYNNVITKPLQVSPVTTRRLGSTNLIRDIRGTRTNEFRKKKS